MKINEFFNSHGLDEVLNDIEDIPMTLIATNLPDKIFENDYILKKEFESLFFQFDHEATFAYLKSFHRAKVELTSREAALIARVQLAQVILSTGDVINIYFGQMPMQSIAGSLISQRLKPPPQTRQYLISPPASPPIGWEPALESEPIINYELLQALAQLAPGESHELHPASDACPGIVVTPCPDSLAGPAAFIEIEEVMPNRVNGSYGATRTKLIPQTRCPDR